MDDQYTQCSSQDSILHTFLDRPVMSPMYTDFLKWFNNMSNLNLIPLDEQILFHLKDKKCKLTNAQERRLDLLLYTKYNIYTCKTPISVELPRRIEWQWKIVNCLLFESNPPHLNSCYRLFLLIVRVPCVVCCTVIS